MLASDLSGFPGIGGGSAGFSRNDWIVSSSLTCMIPNALDSARGISRQPTVTSARCSTIPVGFGDALTGRQDIEALVSLRTKEVPAHLQMADEAVSLVLRRHGDTANAGIHRVGQRKVDDARLSAEIDRRFGSPVGQFQQPTAASSCEYIGERVACERLGSDGSHLSPPPCGATQAFGHFGQPYRRRPSTVVVMIITGKPVRGPFVPAPRSGLTTRRSWFWFRAPK